MATVIGKEQLCSTDLKYFRALQGIGGKTLFDRYKSAESSISKNIDAKYRDFLAYPVKEGDKITFYGKKYNETPRLLSDLQDDDLAKYQNIKAETLAHFNDSIDKLNKMGKTTGAEYLADAIKFVDDRFVYCYDDNVVLGVWGMQLKDNIREDISEICKNLAVKKKRPQPDPKPEPEIPVTDEPHEPEPDPQPEETPENPFAVHFNAGEGGYLNGTTKYEKYSGDTVTRDEVPQVETKEGYEFVGWDKNPNNYTVTDNTEFTAQYRPIESLGLPLPWWKRWRFGFRGQGCLSWLLLFLLLTLIFLTIWCCLLKKCNCNWCGCGCPENTEIIIPEPKTRIVPCDAQVASGGEEGYMGIFEMGKNAGTFLFQYDTYTVPDEITIYEGTGKNGKVLFNYAGGTKGMRQENIAFNNKTITVEVIGLGSGTSWEFKVNCPE